MGVLFALDPGAKKMGLACFAEGVLWSARTVETEDEHAAAAAALRFMELEGLHLERLYSAPFAFVCERMHKRPGRSKYDEDLDRVERTRLAIRNGLPGRKWTKTYNPTQWKGNTPKHIHHRRCRQVLAPKELAIWDRSGHDARDAIGIGLFHLNRIKRGGIAA